MILNTFTFMVIASACQNGYIIIIAVFTKIQTFAIFLMVPTEKPSSQTDRSGDPLDLSIVVVTFNTRELTRTCLQYIEKYRDGVSSEVWVVDSASQDGTADMAAQEFPGFNLIRMQKNLGFAAANNLALRQARGRYILLLNPDAFLEARALKKAVAFMDANPKTGVLGCKLTDPDGSMQPSARMAPSLLNKFLHVSGMAARFPGSRFFGRVDYSWWDHAEPRNVGWVVGAFFMIRRETFETVGLLDDRYFLYFEEIDYCKTVHDAGWEVTFYPGISIVHLGGQSSDKNEVSSKGRQMVSIRLKSEYRYFRKYGGWFVVVAAAALEYAWNLLVLAKNALSDSPNSALKRKEALSLLSLIPSVLWNDGFGKVDEESIQPALQPAAGKTLI